MVCGIPKTQCTYCIEHNVEIMLDVMHVTDTVFVLLILHLQ